VVHERLTGDEVDLVGGTLKPPQIAVAGDIDEAFHIFAVVLVVDEDRRRDFVPVPRIVLVILEVPLDLPALAVERDTLGEVAGDGGLHDAADRRLELVGHLGERSLTLGFGLAVLLGLGLGFALRILRRFDLEGFDGPGDIADLVLALEPRQHYPEIARGQLLHAPGQGYDRI